MVLKVFRWAPGFRERLQRFWVPAKEGMTVLDALVDAQRRLDPTLAFRYACRVGMCGSCAMVVNGRERWACRTLLKTLKTGIVTVRPLYHFPLVRDLVVDMAPLAEQTARVGGVFVPAATPKDIVAKLSSELARIIASPEGVAGLEALSLVPVGGTAEAFDAALRRDLTRWADVVTATGVKGE